MPPGRSRWMIFCLAAATGAGAAWFPVQAAGRGIGAQLREALSELPAGPGGNGILYDRVLGLSGIERYDGGVEAPPLGLSTWRQIYFELRGAAADPASWPTLEEIERQADQEAAKGVIPLALLDVFYDRIRPDALLDGSLRVRDGKILQGIRSPVEERRVFAAAALKGFTYRGERVAFRFAARDFPWGARAAPGPLLVDFADGEGIVPVERDAIHTVRYATPGEKTLRVRTATADGTSLFSSFLFDVRTLTAPAPNDTLHVTASIPYQGVQGTGDAYVYLSERHTSLQEPVVVIEGFDPANTMNWDELYALLNREQLLETLRSQGFDAVVLNFTDGGTYLQRNAFVAVQLIQQIEGMIGPGRTMTVAGASMGGLLGRYALSYMESHALPHQVRTFVSIDAPQEGANIPLGIQYWLWFFSGESADAATFLAQLDTPAARQLLVYHHTDPPGSTGQSDPLRDEFLADLAATGGYPTALRKVAIANGSGDQATQGFNAGEQIISWEYTSFLVDITGNCWAAPNGTHLIFHGLIDYIFLPPDEVSVTVTGALPFDNAPGGWKNSMALLDAVDPGYGDIIAPYPNHCFIPSVSALDLDTTDLFYNIRGDAQILDHTPFDAVYFPSVNEEHVDSNAENAVWLLAEIQQGANGITEGPVGGPLAARIESVFPNPSAGEVTIRFTAPRIRPGKLGVYDASGRRIALLVERDRDGGNGTAGQGTAVWDGRDQEGRQAGSGVYIIRVQGGGSAASGKLVVPR